MCSTQHHTLLPACLQLPVSHTLLHTLLHCVLLHTLLESHTAAAGEVRGLPVVPHWVTKGRNKREAGPVLQASFPSHADVLLESDGRELLLLKLERNNELLGPEFTESHYSDDGQLVTLRPNYTDHCYYHGRVHGHSDSWLALSTCSGLRGLIALNSSDSYYVEPSGSGDSVRHTLYRTDELSINGGTCGHDTHTHLNTSTRKPLHDRVKRNTWSNTKYVELYIVADHTLYRKQNSDLMRTKQRILEVANYVDKFYRALNIRVPLVGLEVWTERNQCTVLEDPNTTLWSFLQWKQKLRSRKKHDNAQLLTGVTFRGTTIGMAPLEGMCSQENSGGINMDHSELPIGAAATMAHEIGHNFGMNHDNEGCCVEAAAEEGGCVMAAATGHPFPRVFSRCSRTDLQNYLHKGGGMCLYNLPNVKDLVAGQRCGNGFVEYGEECDCGEPEECSNTCCNANNCTLRAGAQCGHGVCCQDCKLKQAGTLCRDQAGVCDLPEYCTGSSPLCPANVYLLDGSTCQHGQAYCYSGMCLTYEQQCVQLWGHGARPAQDVCFQDVNAAGNDYGNCGRDGDGNYVKCAASDAKCGKIQCQSSAQKPLGTNAVSVDTTIRTNGREIKCRGTHVYSTHQSQSDLPDPGLVITGTKCGDGKVCWDRRCQNVSYTELESCISHCHGRGVCNNNGHCHCESGWAPPFCEQPGSGGSVDSGPIHNQSQQMMVAGLLLAVLLAVAVLVVLLCCVVKSSPYHRWLRQKNAAESRNKTAGQQERNKPTFHLKGFEPSTGSREARKTPLPSCELLPLTFPPLCVTGPSQLGRPSTKPPRPSVGPSKHTHAQTRAHTPPTKPQTPKHSRNNVPAPAPVPVCGQRALPLKASPVRPPPPRTGKLLVAMPPSKAHTHLAKVSTVPTLRVCTK